MPNNSKTPGKRATGTKTGPTPPSSGPVADALEPVLGRSTASRTPDAEPARPFYRREDWWACLPVFLISFAVYVYTLAPTVTLEDSGELVVAADYLGVPHPPGYPVWTILSWFFQWIFGFVRYLGHPNPAWGVGLFSALGGAVAAGLTSLLASRTGYDLLSKRTQDGVPVEAASGQTLLVWATAVSAGLMFAFSPLLWSQCVIAEVYALNTALHLAILVLAYQWLHQPGREKLIYLTAFVAGVTFTNCQPVVLLVPALLMIIFINDIADEEAPTHSAYTMFWLSLVLLGVSGWFAYLAYQDGLSAPPLATLAENRVTSVVFGLAGVVLFFWIVFNRPWPVWKRMFELFVNSFFADCLAFIFLAGAGMLVFMVHQNDLMSATKATMADPKMIASVGCGIVGGLIFLWTVYHRLFPEWKRMGVLLVLLGSTAYFALFSVDLFFMALFGRLMPAGDLETLVPKILGSGVFAFFALGWCFKIVSEQSARRDHPKSWQWMRWGLAVLMAANVAAMLVMLVKGKPVFTDIYPLFSLKNAINIVFVLDMVVMYLWVVYLYPEWRRILLCVFFGLAGTMFFLYMPLASDFNPPMNWAYPRTWEGFKHSVTRGQYQKLNGAWAPTEFVDQAVAYLGELESQFTIIPMLAVFVLVFCWRQFDRRTKWWLAGLTVSLFFLGFFLMAMLNPGHDVQAMFIAKVQLVQSAGIYVFLLGYGLLLGLVLLTDFFRGNKLVVWTGVLLCLALPSIGVYESVLNEEQNQNDGTNNLRGHDFGWQFGNYQLRGAEAITEELKPGEAPLPNPDYPPAMGPNAVFYGGTDPGRFVPTYMIYSAQVRPDVFLITQNALADNTYLNVMRDLYGDRIWISSGQDSNQAFKTYLDDVKAGRIPMSAAINVDSNGRVSVQGVQGVMEINGIIAKTIFEKNKRKHPFYVEESYVINWMYPYLSPHGLIMKINNEPLPGLTPEMVKNDMDFWAWYCKRLLGDRKFLEDAVARKTFSKLRCAISGIYVYRRMFTEAELAYKQAIELCPLSPEANFRLADLYLQHGRFEDARTVMNANYKMDPKNKNIESFLNQIGQVEQANKRMMELQIQLSTGGTLEAAMELSSLYQVTGREKPFRDLTSQILNNTNLPPAAYLEIAKMFANGKPPNVLGVVEAFQRYLQREPADTRVWVELSYAQLALGQKDQALVSLRQAVQLGGEPVKEHARQDKRFEPLYGSEPFQKLVAPSRKNLMPGPDRFKLF
ncbi:MAG: DUF2723 domain-containing protein [Lentisphaerae bacterium]|nr:DUF2723 domain-containing protein [Lentisphaerota bacterium]